MAKATEKEGTGETETKEEQPAVPRLRVKGFAHVPDGFVDELSAADLAALKANHPDIYEQLQHAIKQHEEAHAPKKEG